ncbi:replication factor subunit 2, putative [Bodo saltans]|uniref:Replication factor subunit 2, putative n=1 Tax=Bodo saltans TaxID=75058 RepID=A0A0S4JFI8_BODSA|nr:replication factor subunit 2, putative [Bodo saltans]|eukprot:CUG90264.1 replication factor subunit 2, putative [Bodo saltans]
MAEPLLSKGRRVESGNGVSAGSKPWVEKYRPKKLDDIQAQEEAVNALRACLKSGAMMPHLLFYGPPGTGKTTSVLAVAHELFGPDYIKARVREMNASDDRGIQVVREKVKVFAQGAVSVVGSKVQSDGNTYPVPPFKLVILDEADALLPDAQAALRRMMEDFTDVTRFCILCNYVSKIIDPIASRCAKFRFKPLTKNALLQRITFIAESEGIQLSPKSVEKLDEAAQGDLRLAIMHLQSAVRARGKDLRNEDFVAVSGAVPEQFLLPYLTALTAKNMDEVIHLTQSIVSNGFAAHQVLMQVHRFLISPNCGLASSEKAALSIKLCEVEKRLADRGDDYIQLMDMGAAFCTVRKV